MRTRHVCRPLHRVEYKELWFRAEERRISQSCGLEVRLATFCDRSGIPLITLHVGWFDHVARNRQRCYVQEGIDKGRSRIGQQEHVGSLNALPAGNRGTVEEVA